MPLNYKGLYVASWNDFLGIESSENHLLSYAAKNGFTTLTLYNIQKVLKKGEITTETTNQLAHFISKARTIYKIPHITAVAENADFFTNVISKYNHVRKNPSEAFDAYNVEFEFWNMDPIEQYYYEDYLKPLGLQCNTADAYKFFISQMKLVHTLAKVDGVKCETYVGSPTDIQAKGILPYIDRVLIHAYVKDPAISYAYCRDRLRYFGTAGKVNIIIIFSAEEEFSGPWLSQHKEPDAYQAFLKGYNVTPTTWKKNNITLQGYQWYVDNVMPMPLV